MDKTEKILLCLAIPSGLGTVYFILLAWIDWVQV